MARQKVSPRLRLFGMRPHNNLISHAHTCTRHFPHARGILSNSFARAGVSDDELKQIMRQVGLGNLLARVDGQLGADV